MDFTAKTLKIRFGKVALLLLIGLFAFLLAGLLPARAFGGRTVYAQTEGEALPPETGLPEEAQSEDTEEAAREEETQAVEESPEGEEEESGGAEETSIMLLEDAQTENLIPIYRLYNPDNLEHLFTSDLNEKETLYNKHEWGYEGIAWYSQSSGTPVYRLYQPKLRNHLYTTDLNEVNVLQKYHGWTIDNQGKPLFYSSGSIPVYRVYNKSLNGLHHWTTDANEYSVLGTRGWSREGAKFYAAKLGEPIYTQYLDTQTQGNTSVSGKYGWVAGKRTVKNALLTALQPVGNTLYIYGGGWNQADTGAGTEAVTLGVSAQWQSFFRQQNASYNYKNYMFQIHNGLDCSGYIGWVVYNVRNTQNNQAGFVYGADKQAKNFANMGLGKYTPAGQSTQFLPGDIVSMEKEGHVYMVIGQCTDGSVVLAHSSPPGVMISGTRSASGGETQATRLANTYMSRYFPEYYSRYASQINRPYAYKSGARFTWSERRLGDPEGLRSMSAEQVLKNLFNEK